MICNADLSNAALILEGGAMRSVYTAAVLDVFLQHHIEFPYLIGVSAGALTAANYVSKQAGRSACANIDHVRDPRYIGFKHLIREGSIFHFDFLFGEPLNLWIPFDHDTFFHSRQKFLIQATDCLTGAPLYPNYTSYDDLTKALTASSSLPMLAPIAYVGNTPCLDGGISNAIPFDKAMADGYDKIVIILTRHKSFRKKNSPLLNRVLQLRYREYPNLIEKICTMSQRYNAMLDRIDVLEQAGRIFVIRPQKPVRISRMEKNQKKLRALYECGLADAQRELDAMAQYLHTGKRLEGNMS